MESDSNSRQSSIVKIAFKHIAEKGLEGLRVRSVATEANMNHATLLHYFPSKEDLIRAVVEYLLQEFQGGGSEQAGAAHQPPMQQIMEEIEDIGVRLKQNLDMFTVLIELTMRARRDPSIKQYLEYLDVAWQSHLDRILQQGVDDQSFRADLNTNSVALTLMSHMKGLSLQALHMPHEQINSLALQVQDEVKRWLSQ